MLRMQNIYYILLYIIYVYIYIYNDICNIYIYIYIDREKGRYIKYKTL